MLLFFFFFKCKAESLMYRLIALTYLRTEESVPLEISRRRPTAESNRGRLVSKTKEQKI